MCLLQQSLLCLLMLTGMTYDSLGYVGVPLAYGKDSWGPGEIGRAPIGDIYTFRY